jgi:hypothetical protein
MHGGLHVAITTYRCCDCNIENGTGESEALATISEISDQLRY